MTEQKAPLLLRRNVQPTEHFLRWVADRGGPTDPVGWAAWDPHVTVMWSPTPAPWPQERWEHVDVACMPGEAVVAALRGGTKALMLDRCVGPSGALHASHRNALALGHTYDFDPYRPHVTLWRGYVPSATHRSQYDGFVNLGPETAKVPKKYRAKWPAPVERAPWVTAP